MCIGFGNQQLTDQSCPIELFCSTWASYFKIWTWTFWGKPTMLQLVIVTSSPNCLTPNPLPSFLLPAWPYMASKFSTPHVQFSTDFTCLRLWIGKLNNYCQKDSGVHRSASLNVRFEDKVLIGEQICPMWCNYQVVGTVREGQTPIDPPISFLGLP